MKFIVNKTTSNKIRNTLSNIGEIYDGTVADIKDKSVSTHPDIQIHFVDNKTAFCAPELYDYYKRVLPGNVKLYKGGKPLGFTYPDDCAYNIARIGNNIICNPEISDFKVLDYYKNIGYNIIAVRQGYAKCNICQLSDDLILTEDKGILHSVTKCGRINAVYMPVGSVSLSGFNYGFIGGASGFTNDTLLLCGKATKELADILKKNNIKYTELSDEPLYDYGSIIPFD